MGKYVSIVAYINNSAAVTKSVAPAAYWPLSFDRVASCAIVTLHKQDWDGPVTGPSQSCLWSPDFVDGIKKLINRFV